jgi:protein-arginine kinase activator protein McsA
MANGKDGLMSEKEIEIWGRALEKMTTTELRELAKGIEGVSGVHAMKKEELIDALRQSKGIVVEAAKKRSSSVRAVKEHIRSLKAKRHAAIEAKDRKTATILRRKISRLKKQTRRAAA